MFMPHANAISPAWSGVNSIVAGWLSGSSRLTFNDANTTAVAHVLSLVLTNVMRAGTPARNTRRSGLKLASVTVTRASCTFASVRVASGCAGAAGFAGGGGGGHGQPGGLRLAAPEEIPSPAAACA